MTDTMADKISQPIVPAANTPILSRLLPAVALYWLVTAGAIAAIYLPRATDLIGPDNDDVMRLVEIRDWLGGQGWFDLMQYRLGVDGNGTLMHWSRFIDAPIGGLMELFSLFMPMTAAEGAAASLWPLLLAGPLLLAIGLAGRRMGGALDGPRIMHIALGLGALFIFTSIKFRPGALDHHNVQMILAMSVAALLADRAGKPVGHALAGIAAALAIAIGAETMPFIAAACLCVAARWIWQGAAFSSAARAFGLSLALAISAAFFATVPPSAYSAVTCDNLSLGFYSLSGLGGVGLFGLTLLPRGTSIAGRTIAALAFGAILGAVALWVAPQCLASPLANLDPLLVDLWLSHVSEAQNIIEQARTMPESVGGFYAVGLFAFLVCLFRIWTGRERGLHLLFLTLIGITFAVALIQLRGTLFSNLLAIPPLALLIGDLQRMAREKPKSIPANLGFVLVTLASAPAVWMLGGILAIMGLSSVNLDTLTEGNAAVAGECGNAADMAALMAIAPTTVAAPSNSGADILRYTGHSVLTGPYHRNQVGMLAELHIGISPPAEALSVLKSSGATVLAFCKTDPQTEKLIAARPAGLYAALAKGEVPAYLTPVASTGEFRIFNVNPAASE